MLQCYSLNQNLFTDQLMHVAHKIQTFQNNNKLDIHELNCILYMFVLPFFWTQIQIYTHFTTLLKM